MFHLTGYEPKRAIACTVTANVQHDCGSVIENNMIIILVITHTHAHAYTRRRSWKLIIVQFVVMYVVLPIDSVF